MSQFRRRAVVIVDGVKYETRTLAMDWQGVHIGPDGVDIVDTICVVHQALIREKAEGIPRNRAKFLELIDDFDFVDDDPDPAGEGDMDPTPEEASDI